MKVIILAAGMGSRLADLTSNSPKCLLEVNSEPLLKHIIDQIPKGLNIEIITGFCSQQIEDFCETNFRDLDISFTYNSEFASSNNSHSFTLFEPSDCIIIESDLYFNGVIQELVEKEDKNLAVVGKSEPYMDGAKVDIENDNIIFKGDGKYKTANIWKLSKESVMAIQTKISEGDTSLYYEDFFINEEIKPFIIEEWYEIDTKHDLEIVNIMTSDTENRYRELSTRFGGYWNFKINDFLLLENPYFPCEKFIKDFQLMTPSLVRNYPSGSDVQTELVSNMFDIRNDFTLVANGASEIIKALPKLEGTFSVFVPTFEEFINVFDEVTEVTSLENITTDYLIIVNPNNPTGESVPVDKIRDLLESGVKVIVDESFIEFSDTVSVLPLIYHYENLHVMKSLSKTYGIAGIRLGVMFGQRVQELQEFLPIWNINSFGEYFLSSYIKYRKGFDKSCELVKEQRKYMVNELTKFGIKTYGDGGNFVMCDYIYDGIEFDLLERGMLVKVLENKVGLSGKFLRISVKSKDENEKIIRNLSELAKNME